MANQQSCPQATSSRESNHLLLLLLLSISYEAKIAELYQLPDRMKVSEKPMSEEMLSNQMLSGIPEVDLGLE